MLLRPSATLKLDPADPRMFKYSNDAFVLNASAPKVVILPEKQRLDQQNNRRLNHIDEELEEEKK